MRLCPIGNSTISQETTSFRHTLASDDYGYTDDEFTEPEIGVCSDGINYTAVLISVVGDYSQRILLLPGISEVTGPGGNTTLSNFCTQIQNRQDLGNSSSTRWYMLAAVQAHENVHKAHLQPSLASAYNGVKSLIEGLKVPDTGQSADDTIAQIKALSTYSSTLENCRSLWDAEYVTLITPDHNGPAAAAEHTVVDPMISSICTYAKSTNRIPAWPTCSTCP